MMTVMYHGPEKSGPYSGRVKEIGQLSWRIENNALRKAMSSLPSSFARLINVCNNCSEQFKNFLQNKNRKGGKVIIT